MITGTALRQRALASARMSSTYSIAASSPRIVPDSGGEDRVPPFSTVTTLSQNLYNWVSLIGTVVYPFKPMTGNSGSCGAHTILLVNHPPFRPPWRIRLSVSDLLAERALAHLKPNDNIYVSGQLGSYSKFTSKGTELLYYKVTANEMNYVQVPDESYLTKSGEEIGECLEQKHRRRLPLWQSLFANPDEWYDYRKTKKHWRHPDFRHKKTDEALWLNRDDPSWVKEHVKLLDSGLSETEGGEMPFGSRSEGISGHQLASSDSMETDLLNDMSNEK